MLLSLFLPQYGLFWAICPSPIIKYIHTHIRIRHQDLQLRIVQKEVVLDNFAGCQFPSSVFLEVLYLPNVHSLRVVCCVDFCLGRPHPRRVPPSASPEQQSASRRYTGRTPTGTEQHLLEATVIIVPSPSFQRLFGPLPCDLTDSRSPTGWSGLKDPWKTLQAGVLSPNLIEIFQDVIRAIRLHSDLVAWEPSLIANMVLRI